MANILIKEKCDFNTFDGKIVTIYSCTNCNSENQSILNSYCSNCGEKFEGIISNYKGKDLIKERSN